MRHRNQHQNKSQLRQRLLRLALTTLSTSPLPLQNKRELCGYSLSGSNTVMMKQSCTVQLLAKSFSRPNMGTQEPHAIAIRCEPTWRLYTHPASLGRSAQVRGLWPPHGVPKARVPHIWAFADAGADSRRRNLSWSMSRNQLGSVVYNLPFLSLAPPRRMIPAGDQHLLHLFV